MIPGPRPPKGHHRPSGARDPGRARPVLSPAPPASAWCDGSPMVAVTRTARGWSVISPLGTEHADDLVEGLSLADLVAEELGGTLEPDRTARRSARGPGSEPGPEGAVDPRLAALERTVAQLEHALAARVSTERAIGVLAERHGTSARVAFEALRQDARSQGRPVADLAREVLQSLLGDLDPACAEGAALHVAPLPPAGRTRIAAPPSALASVPPADAVADGRP